MIIDFAYLLNKTFNWKYTRKKWNITFECVLWNFEIEWSRALTNSSWCIIMGTMAWTVVSTEITSVSNWYTTQMGAYSDNDQPFWILSTFLDVNRVAILVNWESFNLRQKSHIDAMEHCQWQIKTLTASVCGSLNSPIGTAFSLAISLSTRWRTNKGLPRHVKVTDFPSGISPNLTSIVPILRASRAAPMYSQRLRTVYLALYKPVAHNPSQKYHYQIM